MPQSSFLTLAQAAAALRAGETVGMPTETVYGLAADATNPTAVAKVFEAKGRPTFDPLIVHIPDVDWLPRVAREYPIDARRLVEAFWPGPLTLILPRTAAIPDLVTSGLDTVGVRLPAHDLARELMRTTGLPLAAPSANLFGRTSPTTAQHVLDQLAGRIAGVLDGGPCAVGLESTIVSFADGTPTLLRHGGISAEELRPHLCSTLRIPAALASGAGPRETSQALQAPGTLASHYCPLTPLFFFESTESAAAQARVEHEQLQGRKVGTLGMRELSPTGDLCEAAANLYAAMRNLDTKGLDLVVALGVGNRGLGAAIDDRLRRASVRT